MAEADKSTIEQAIADLKTALEGEDLADIEAKSNALGEASMKLGEAMYAATQAEAEEAAESAEAASEAADEPQDDVVDADFEEVKDDDQKKSA